MNCFSGVFRFPFFVTVFIILSLLTDINFSYAQSTESIDIISSMNPVGSGARAIGMGGAFIAVADDATAASWNPGGLIQLETPEISVVGAYFNRNEDNEFGNNPEASGPQEASKGALNYLSAAYPFRLIDRNMIVSINYQQLYDFTRYLEFPVNFESDRLQVNQNIDWEQEGSLSAIGIAYAVQITPKLSFGFTLNFWEDSLSPNSWEQTTKEEGTANQLGSIYTFNSINKEKYEFSGLNFNLGLLWNITDQLVFGAVFKSPFTADLKYTLSYREEILFPDNPSEDTTDSSFLDEDETLDMPMSYGVGLSYRISDELTASGDIYRTEWEDYVHTDYTGQKISPITGKPISDSDISATTQVRLGIEYLIIENRYVVPLRGGVFYDPAPIDEESDDFYGVSMGSGIVMGSVVFDLAYQYRFGYSVGSSIVANSNFSQDVNEHTVYTSMIIHF